MKVTLEVLKNLFEEIPEAPKQETIWLNRNTFDLIPKSSKENPLAQFYAYQVNIDNSLPDNHFETGTDRNKRFKITNEQKKR